MGEVAGFQAQPALMPDLKKEMAISDVRLAASLGNGWKSFLLISTSALKNKSISYQSFAGDAAGREWQPVQRGKWKQGNAFQMCKARAGTHQGDRLGVPALSIPTMSDITMTFFSTPFLGSSGETWPSCLSPATAPLNQGVKCNQGAPSHRPLLLSSTL